MGFGSRDLSTVVFSRLSIAAAEDIEYKVAGAEFDWSTVTAVTEDTVLDEDGNTIQLGEKYIPMGSVLFLNGGAGGVLNIADDGDTLVRDETFILEQTIIYNGYDSNIGNLITGGHVYKGRVKAGGMSEPTIANLRLALPKISLVTTV